MMSNTNTLLLLARKALTNIQTPILTFRCFCSQSTSALSSSPSAPSNKLFVAGLSWSMDERSLKDAFSSFGEVTEVRIVYDKDSGRSRGFGFVDFANENDAQCAKDAMDGKARRPLKISFALEKVRGGPVAVPRLSNINNLVGRRS
ncbi:glycine-rich RNA-binding protein 3 [Cucumis melo var. makuwa]|uniref:Glycine-rich RNA-binding protein 3 n=1 Tax=Cucumis melo var. makuwa TaxID=1194695 RepID=A0A5D3CH06_CUCMM|nr:glycine-rich RNA-binding protein 3 [Cucumis melo var. makuwa]TYK09579.1 glycine-rich RNA-binding protein 3 [Cucumis melo var. makuwa]